MNQNYEFTGETLEWKGRTLRKIQSKCDIKVNRLLTYKKDNLYGWVSNEYNLQDNAILLYGGKIYDKAIAKGNAIVHNAELCDHVFITDNVKISNYVTLSEYANVRDDVNIRYATITGHPIISGRVEISGSGVEISGDAVITGDVIITDNVKISGNPEISGSVILKDDVTVDGYVKLFGDFTLRGDAHINSYQDYMVFKDNFASGNYFAYTRSNDRWHITGSYKMNSFYGTTKVLTKELNRIYENINDEYVTPGMVEMYRHYIKLVKAMNKLHKEYPPQKVRGI